MRLLGDLETLDTKWMNLDYDFSSLRIPLVSKMAGRAFFAKLKGPVSDNDKEISRQRCFHTLFGGMLRYSRDVRLETNRHRSVCSDEQQY